MANAGVKKMQVSPKHMPKAQLKMKALVAEVRRFWDVCAEVEGGVSPGAIVTVDIDPVINLLDNALVIIRTLDHEVFEASDPKNYVALRAASREGIAVRALTAPRNNAVHSSDVVDPDLARAIGPLESGRFIVFPRWKRRKDMPIEMFQHAQGKKAGQDHLNYMASYDQGASGRFVLDTLLDAYSFFDRCDPTVSEKHADGKLVGFPLPPLPVGGYRRLAPDWPDHADVDKRIRHESQAVAPAGLGREILGFLDDGSGLVFCGKTTFEGGKQVFTETAEQIRQDLSLDYEYKVQVGDLIVEVELDGAELVVAGRPLADLPLPNWTPPSTEPWAGFWELASDDAAYYRNQRRPT